MPLTVWWLVRRHLGFVGWVLAVALGAALFFTWRDGIAARAVAKQEVQMAERTVHRWQVLAARRDRVVQADTVILTKWATHYDTLRQTLDVHDTVQVLRYVAAADSTVHACRATVAACIQAGIAKDSVIAGQDRELTALRRLQPTTVGRTLTALRWLAIGFGTAYVATHTGMIR